MRKISIIIFALALVLSGCSAGHKFSALGAGESASQSAAKPYSDTSRQPGTEMAETEIIALVKSLTEKGNEVFGCTWAAGQAWMYKIRRFHPDLLPCRKISDDCGDEGRYRSGLHQAFL